MRTYYFKPTTLEQRLAAYWFCLEELEERLAYEDKHRDTFFLFPTCSYLSRYYYQQIMPIASSIMAIPYEELEKLFPEFFAQKPSNAKVDEMWWSHSLDGHQLRRQAIQLAILMTQTAIKHQNEKEN